MVTEFRRPQLAQFGIGPELLAVDAACVAEIDWPAWAGHVVQLTLPGATGGQPDEARHAP